MAGVELNDDMVSLKPVTVKAFNVDATFREGMHVFYRNGTYYISFGAKVIHAAKITVFAMLLLIRLWASLRFLLITWCWRKMQRPASMQTDIMLLSRFRVRTNGTWFITALPTRKVSV